MQQKINESLNVIKLLYAIGKSNTDIIKLSDNISICREQIASSIEDINAWYNKDFINLLLKTYINNESEIEVYPACLIDKLEEYFEKIKSQPKAYAFIPVNVIYSEQNVQRDKLHDEETVKQKLAKCSIPNNFQLGAAIGQGDCFFDAMAQSLNMLEGKKEYTAKSLRLLCNDYVKSGKHEWVKETIEAEGDNYEQYLVRISFTIEELEEEEKANTGLKLEDIVWGRPEIEGRIICELINVKLHVIGVLEQPINGMDVTEQLVDAHATEPITTIEKGKYDVLDTIHLINHQNHFVPLLNNKVLAGNLLTKVAKHSKDKNQWVALIINKKHNFMLYLDPASNQETNIPKQIENLKKNLKIEKHNILNQINFTQKEKGDGFLYHSGPYVIEIFKYYSELFEKGEDITGNLIADSNIFSHMAVPSLLSRNIKDIREQHIEEAYNFLKRKKSLEQSKFDMNGEFKGRFKVNANQKKPVQSNNGYVSESRLEGENELDKQLSELGYLTNVRINDNKNLKKFTWDKIPMLAVITGKNGIGKTALLEGILKGFEEKIINQQQFQVELNFNKDKGGGGSIPDIFEFSSSNQGGLIRGTSTHSTKRYEEDINDTFNDLKSYDLSNRYNRKYSLKYPKLKVFYDNIINSFEKENTLQANSLSNDYQYQFYNGLKAKLEESIGIHISTYGSLEKFPKYLLERGTSVKQLNDFLQKKEFKYILSDNCFDDRGKFVSLSFQGKNSNEIVDIGWLSPGENLQFLTLLWIFASKIIYPSDTGSILLLDEFDAHLHPSLAKGVIEAIKTKLIGEYGVQVIMTTHNPTTVSLVPKDNLYIMSDENNNKKVEIKKAISKKQAIQLLTSDFVCINEPFRLIFVEAESDKKFYQLIREKLILLDIIKPNEQMLFMAHSKNKKDSNCDLVISIVENCVEDSKDEDKNLREYIFGIVDGDNKEKHYSPNIFALRRYSIENYIYDPIYIYFSNKYKNSNSPEFIEVNNLISQHCKKVGLKVPESFDEIFSYSKQNKTIVLQIIIDCISDKLLTFFEENIKNNNPKVMNLIKTLEGVRFRHLLQANKQLTKDKEPVVLADGVKLIYYKFLLEMQGHDLEYLYSCFSAKTDKKEKIIDKGFIQSQICKTNMLIPIEFVDIFNKLQNPLQNYNYQKPLNDEKKSSNFETVKQKNGEIEAYKQQLANKDKKLNNQTKKITELEQSIRNSKVKFEKTQISWSTQNSLRYFLKANKISNKKSFEYEDKNTIIDSKLLSKNKN